MKNYLTIIASFILVTNVAHAGKSIQLSTKNFDAVPWTSENSNDTVTIQTHGDYNFFLFISVEREIMYEVTGINVKNCGSITHIDPGSSVVCRLNAEHPSVTFSSDKIDGYAKGTYQIEKP